MKDLTNFRQFRAPTGVPHGNRQSLLTARSTIMPKQDLWNAIGAEAKAEAKAKAAAAAAETEDVIMVDAPGQQPTYLDRATDYYTHNLAPTIEPALLVAADHLRRGVKRTADHLIGARDRIVEQYIEIRRSSDDGLAIKRFKRLPIDPSMATTKAVLTNLLPVDYLKTLGNGRHEQFRWTDDVLAHLHPVNHERVVKFIEELVEDACSTNFIHLDSDTYTGPIDPRNVPAHIDALIKASGKSEKTTILLHNHMMDLYNRNDDQLFKNSGEGFISALMNLKICHHHTYYNGGRIPSFKEHGLQPYGPLKFPYTAVNADPNVERYKLLHLIDFTQFLLRHRDLFNQMFPADTFAGIIADLDAIRKDQPPPSYVDWPEKHLRVPGAWPEDYVTHQLLFETIDMRDFEPERLWDFNNPSPEKEIKFEDYDTPIRNAMKKNRIFYRNGYPEAGKAAMREARTPAEKELAKRVRFIQNVAYYVKPKNTPCRYRTPSKNRVAKNTPEKNKVSGIPKGTKTKNAGDGGQSFKLMEDDKPPKSHRRFPKTPGGTKATKALEASQGTPNSFEVSKPAEIVESVKSNEATEPIEMVEADFGAMYSKNDQQSSRKTRKWIAEQKRLREREAAEDKTASETTKPVEAVKSMVAKKKPTYKDVDDFFEREDQLAWGKAQPMPVSEEKQAEIDIKKQLEAEAAIQREYAAAAEKKRQEEEKRRIREEDEQFQEEQRRKFLELMRLDREKQEQEEAERLARTGELRKPRQPLVSSLSEEWTEKVMGTLDARPNAVLARTPEAAELRQKDFQTVVRPREWLNDEIVNGTLMHVANWANQRAGVEKPNVQTPKSVVFNSFVGKNLLAGKVPSDRILRKNGVRKDNFLDIQNIMIPICRGAHWTLVGVRPTHREVFHLDSLDYKGDRGLMTKALDMVRSILKDAFVENEWKFSKLESPQQMNSDDCGVHTITNGMCLGLGLKMSTYSSKDMPQQRLRIAAVCLNEGFTGDLTLDGI